MPDLESWRAGVKRQLESVSDDTLPLLLRLVMAEMQRRNPKIPQGRSDEDFLRSCGVKP